MGNMIELKTVNELSQYAFFIPSYQRGYRWTPSEVTDLLNDVYDFVPREIKGTDDKTWYCLQPIVVKQKSDNFFEVIDGQQRLTTIYLLLHYLNQDYVETRRDKLFTIEYQTRKGSESFLQNPQDDRDDNIDYYYIHKAYITIGEWFENKNNDLNFDKSEFRSKLKFSTKVIWYETVEENPTRVFTRLNIGKISLTNAELIKALFLNSSNFSVEDEKRMQLSQIEIANEWDNIEYSFQNNKFWYFLSDKHREDNRIEYIFDLMNELETEGEYSAFRYFSKQLSNKSEEEMRRNWKGVQEYFQRFNEWFDDRELYHMIGFILTAQIANVKQLYKNSRLFKKSEFKTGLNELIKNHYRRKKLLEIEYDDKSTKDILLLYNILTMLQNEHESSYFPFDSFKLNTWNKEHIASRKDASSVPEDSRVNWLNDVQNYIDISLPKGEELLNQVKECCANGDCSNDIFEPLYNNVTDYFNQYIGEEGEDVDGISNLALLDEKTNKGYKNAVFPLKRKYIIDLDKSGGFVPLCTKNVFLKYFSDYPPKISFWTKDDREKYEEDLIRVLGEYIEVEDDENER